ncbi:MAG: dTMP kinase [Thermoguttaceae bacterium]|nr:dTMP kinase [Thermoguttaceae bacterium]
MFLCIEGGDGTGKSTQVVALKNWLTEQKIEVVTCRDPGTTPLGESVRDILLHRNDLSISPESEMLLFMAARAQMMNDIIRPALEAGKWVLVDRFLLSTVVYQGYAANRPVKPIWTIGKIATRNTLPDLTFVLDLPHQIAFERIHRTPDRMETKGLEYRTRVCEGFRRAVQETQAYTSGTYFLIDAQGHQDEVFKKIVTLLEQSPDFQCR